jgi:hypothetical protein
MRTLSTLTLATLLLLPACAKDGDTGDITDADGDGYAAWEDCNDRDPAVFPGANESCDGRDNDCDDEIDEGATITLYRDADLDGYGDPDSETMGCEGTGGYSAEGTDCDDADAEVHPGAEEWCDGLDNDCDEQIDEDIEYADWYADVDEDGYGDPTSSINDCQQPSGYIADDQDCDDGDATINPDADEYCDGEDNDCDGGTDEADALDASTWYSDGDGDGYGDAGGKGTVRCAAGSGEVLDNTDCDDSRDDVNPGGTEICDGDADEDCDGLVDDADDSTDPSSMSTWHPDGDSDGYGDAGSSLDACSQPSGHIADGSDCDDSDAEINPAMEETCNGSDDDCDGLVDDDDVGVTGTTTWYLDADGDGYGSSRGGMDACDQPTGYVADNTDCDDDDGGIHVGCPEDTGDVFTRDGSYTGDLDIAVEVSTLGITDTCAGTATVEVDELGSVQITGTGDCSFSGVLGTLMGSQSGALEGEITSDPSAEGTVSVGDASTTIISDDWTGSFTDDDTLYGEFEGSTTYLHYTIDYLGTFEVSR